MTEQEQFTLDAPEAEVVEVGHISPDFESSLQPLVDHVQQLLAEAYRGAPSVLDTQVDVHSRDTKRLTAVGNTTGEITWDVDNDPGIKDKMLRLFEQNTSLSKQDRNNLSIGRQDLLPFTSIAQGIYSVDWDQVRQRLQGSEIAFKAGEWVIAADKKHSEIVYAIRVSFQENTQVNGFTLHIKVEPAT